MKRFPFHTIAKLAPMLLASLAAVPHTFSAPTLREALAQAVRSPDHHAQIRAIYAALAARPNEDFTAAITQLQGLDTHSVILGETIGYWFERDAAAARAWMDEPRAKSTAYDRPIFAAWARVDPEGMIEWLRGSDRAAQFEHAAREALINGLAKENPAAAAELSLRFSKGGSNSVISEQSFFSAWACRDPEAAAVRALAVPASDLKLNAIKGVVSGWSEADPEAARRWAAALDDAPLRQAAERVLTMREQLFGAKAVQPAQPAPVLAPPVAANPNVPALNAALGHASNMHIYADFFVLLERLGPEATARGLEAASQQGQTRVFTVLSLAYNRWAQKNLDGFRAHVEQMQDRETRDIARICLLKSWDAVDAGAARAWAERLPAAERDGVLRSIEMYTKHRTKSAPKETIDRTIHDPGKRGEAMGAFHEWAGKDPAGASAYALRMQGKLEREMAISAVVWTWGSNDPAAALAWIMGLDSENRRAAISRLFDAWSRKDREAALTAARALADRELRPVALAQVAEIMLWHEAECDRAIALLEDVPLAFAVRAYGSWGRREPQAAAPVLVRRLVSSATNTSQLREDLSVADFDLDSTIGAWVGKSPADATAFVLDQPDSLRRSLYRAIVAPWAKSDPGAPAQWLLAHADADSREWKSALKDAVAGWATRSEHEVVAWVNALPAGANRDLATTAFARCIIKHHPDEAFACIRTISDAKRQRDSLYEVWISWWPVDRENAFRWLETAKISAEERELLTHGPKQPGQ